MDSGIAKQGEKSKLYILNRRASSLKYLLTAITHDVFCYLAHNTRNP